MQREREGETEIERESSSKGKSLSSIVENKIDNLLNKWDNRLEGCTNTSLFGGSIISRRLSLMKELLRSSNASSTQALRIMVNLLFILFLVV